MEQSQKPKVSVYSTTWCGFCRMTKEYLKAHGVAFEDINLEQDVAAAGFVVEKTQQRGVPVIQIGDEFIVGFDRPKIDAALKANSLV